MNKDAEIQRLRDALMFYGREWELSTPVGGQGIYTVPTDALIDDKGERAREALFPRESE